MKSLGFVLVDEQAIGAVVWIRVRELVPKINPLDWCINVGQKQNITLWKLAAEVVGSVGELWRVRYHWDLRPYRLLPTLLCWFPLWTLPVDFQSWRQMTG